MKNTILKSELDSSVNFIENQLVGFLESRYVRKVDDYFICYLSSQSSCSKGCRFCHLTATKQTSAKDCDYQDFLNQALQVFRHYRSENKPAKYIHYNFMARGEVLANKYFLKEADSILSGLGNLAIKDGLNPKFNISTIIPKTFKYSFNDIFKLITPTIYYSVYSMNEKFRRDWIPAGMNPEQAFDLLKEYQNVSKKIVKIHFAFIKDQNDSIEDLNQICEAIDKRNLLCEFNLVRYNPFSPEQGCESDIETIERNIEYLKNNFKGNVKIIPRVGFDVKASCGMFV